MDILEFSKSNLQICLLDLANIYIFYHHRNSHILYKRSILPLSIIQRNQHDFKSIFIYRRNHRLNLRRPIRPRLNPNQILQNNKKQTNNPILFILLSF